METYGNVREMISIDEGFHSHGDTLKMDGL